VLPPGELNRNITSCLIQAHYRNAVRGVLCHGHGQQAQKFGEDRQCSFRVMRAYRHQTDIRILCIPPGRGGAVTLSHLWNTRDAQQSPLCEYVTSSTKPEVHNVLQRPQSQMRIEPRPQATCTKFGEVCHVVFSARCIIYNSRLCYVVSVRLSVCL